MSYDVEECPENLELRGALEWISLQRGTLEVFNPGLIIGRIHDLSYRYFITEGWIGLRTPECSDGKVRECLNLDEFKREVLNWIN